MLSINPSELIWTIINFFLMLFLLKHFLYTPVSEFMEKRQAKIDAGRAEERRAEEELNANRERLGGEPPPGRPASERYAGAERGTHGGGPRRGEDRGGVCPPDGGSGAGRPVRSGRGGAGGPQGRAFRPAHRPGFG